MRLLITEPSDFDDQALQALQAAGMQVDCVECTYTQLFGIIEHYDGVIVRLGLPFDAPLLAAGSRLRFIATLTTGTDHIAVDAAQQQGITVLSLRGERHFLDTITSTAELAFALILELYRHTGAAHQAVVNNEWNRNLFFGHEISRKTIGIIGLGRLGSQVARIGQAFGAKIIYVDPQVYSPGYQRLSTLQELAAAADIISLHVPLMPETIGLIGSDFFAQCRPHALFINTSRGRIVDETALLAALANGKIAGAGLDVLANEVGRRTIDNPLIDYARNHSNIVITPHIGGATYEAMRAVERFMADKIIARAFAKVL